MAKKLTSFINRSAKTIFNYTQKSPEGLTNLTPGNSIKILRQKLDMTQDQLAKRSGIAQSHIAQIEKGKVDPQWGTLKRIFDALLCNLMVVPKPRYDLDQYKVELAQKAAEKKMRKLQGTMSLEKQDMDDETKSALLQRTAEDMLRNHPKKIWDA